MRIVYYVKYGRQGSGIYGKDGHSLYFHTEEQARGFIRNKLLPFLNDCFGEPQTFEIERRPSVYENGKFILDVINLKTDLVFEILDDLDKNMYSKRGIWEFEEYLKDIKRPEPAKAEQMTIFDFME